MPLYGYYCNMKQLVILRLMTVYVFFLKRIGRFIKYFFKRLFFNYEQIQTDDQKLLN